MDLLWPRILVFVSLQHLSKIAGAFRAEELLWLFLWLVLLLLCFNWNLFDMIEGEDLLGLVCDLI